MITLPRLRKRNLSKGPVPVLDSGGICITSLGRGSIWTTASGPRTIPKLVGWATPEGWRRGLRPYAEGDSKPAERTTAANDGNGDGQRNGNGASDHGASLVREIEQMEQALGKRMYRGLLKTLARVWNPKDIQDPAIQQKVLAHMQAAERGFRRLDAALERVGPEALTQILRSLKLQSIDLVDNLQTLREIVLAARNSRARKSSETVDPRGRKHHHPGHSFTVSIRVPRRSQRSFRC